MRISGRAAYCHLFHEAKLAPLGGRGRRRRRRRCFRDGCNVLGNTLALWRVPIFWIRPYFVFLFYLGLAISVTPIYLVTWRLARRFGWRGLAIFTCIVAIVGPPRDYLYAARYPAWMVFAPGAVPIIADGVTYAGIVLIGHAVMCLVAGRSGDDRLRNES
ncbi:MAG TPA: hypothetical protein VK557_12890 [Pyrinomonadaceae bacterium]|nr:hypothetical protein [Pyrinomonadaceae bacterium]